MRELTSEQQDQLLESYGHLIHPARCGSQSRWTPLPPESGGVDPHTWPISRSQCGILLFEGLSKPDCNRTPVAHSHQKKKSLRRHPLLPNTPQFTIWGNITGATEVGPGCWLTSGGCVGLVLGYLSRPRRGEDPPFISSVGSSFLGQNEFKSSTEVSPDP
jgi:hypothetical protein